jgi:hypothetical protein
VNTYGGRLVIRRNSTALPLSGLSRAWRLKGAAYSIDNSLGVL